MFFHYKPIFFLPSIDHYSRFLELADSLGISKNFTITDKVRDSKYYYLPIRIHSYEHLKNKQYILSQVEKYIDNDQMIFFFDFSIETINFCKRIESLLLDFHQILQDLKIPASRVILLNANCNSKKFYDKWVKKNNINYVIKFIGYNFYFFEYYYELTQSKVFQKNLKLLVKQAQENLDRKSKFMCLNLRPKWHRKAILLHLIEKNLLDDGIVTYFGEEFGSKEAFVIDPSNEVDKYIESLGIINNFQENLTKLNDISPLTFERDSKEIRKDLWNRKTGELEFLIPELKLQKPFKKIDSYFEIVNETWATDDSCLFFSEKTIRSLLRLNPFILVSSPYAMRYLKALGFKGFSPYINEAYDDVNDNKLRMEMIFKEIDRLCSLNKEDLQNFYSDLSETVIYNLNHFLNNSPKVFLKEYKDNIESILDYKYMTSNFYKKSKINYRKTVQKNNLKNIL